jgi:UDP-N-acetylmuramoyl-tripeptide--D-alanyl-D-alanine ligase
MGFDDPFTGYSTLLRVIVYGVVPLFTALQVVRLRRALHIFQLEGYKRDRFLQWCAANGRRALFLSRGTAKKPLVMTGRAWRILVLATLLSVAWVLVPSAIAHLRGGAPYDLLTWAVATAAAFLGLPWLLVASDAILTPVQSGVNARYFRAATRKLRTIAPRVVGITGSFGKTSTKFAVRDLAAAPGKAFATPGSYNTPLGVTRAINEGLEPQHELLVVEMGAYREGDIAELCAFVRPTIGVLTAIGPMHLERFGSMDAIRRAKYELIDSLPQDGIAVMNAGDLEVRSLVATTQHVPVITYGIDPDTPPDVAEAEVRIDVTAVHHSYGPNGTAMTIVDEQGNELAVKTVLLGAHAVNHVLAGVAVARARGVPLNELGPRIEALQPVDHRLQLIHGAGGVTIIDDAFNSNPAGAAAAIEVLADLDETDSKRKIVVTPGMIELGELQYEENRRFASHAAMIADYLIVVGTVNRDALCEGARTGVNARAEVIVVDSLADAAEKLAELGSAPGIGCCSRTTFPISTETRVGLPTPFQQQSGEAGPHYEG